MAGDGEEETEYESDPEEVKLSLKMRRREASDDEEEEEDEEEVEEKGEDVREKASAMGSDVESDGQGGAADYDDDELEEEEEYYEDYEEEEEDEVVEEYVENGGAVGDRVRGESEVAEVEVGDSNEGNGHGGEEQVDEEGEKKENEPFMVPTAGAFYMHDDRFRDNAGARNNRRTFAGRKLWESKDEKKWGHDKFEELNTRERPYDEGRKSSRGRSRGRGRGRGTDRGYVRGNRPRSVSENNNNNIAPKTVRGRGPRRYQALTKVKSEAPPPQNKQSQKPIDKATYASSRRVDASAPNMDSDLMPTRRVASSLNSASPPFYPSGTSRKDNTMIQKSDDQTANANRNIHPHMQESLPVQQSNSFLRGKNVVDSAGVEKLYIDDRSLARSMGNSHLPSASLSTNSPQSKGHGRAVPFSGSNSFQASHSQNQGSKTYSTAQAHPARRNHAQGRGQASFPASDRASQSSSPPQSGLSITPLEPGDADPPESSKSKTALVGKGKGTTQGSGRGSFLYSGIQVMGSGGTMGSGHGDQNFPASPAFLPVMQFGAQHLGGIPAVGMAFPGYVGQPQLGMGNSEMTWLPVLTGAGGALGASYCPPYVAVDGSYHARPTGQIPALAASSKENNVNKPSNEGKSQPKSDPVNDEFSQRQKPRRYSEMNFGQ